MAASSEPRSRGRAEVAARAAVIALLAIGVAVTVVRSTRDDDPLAHARDLVADEDNFVTATDSGVTFTKVSTALEDAADDCEPANSARCANLYAAAGYARVSAVGVLRCTRPGVFDARAAMRTLLADLDDPAAAAIPAVVSCG